MLACMSTLSRLKCDQSMHYLLDMFSFFMSLIFCWALDWTSEELVWGFWTTSLSTGFLTIFIGFFLKIFHLASDGGKLNFTATHLLVPALFYVPALLIFGLHFGGFHLGHGSVLNMLFPVAGFFGGIESPPDIKKIPIGDVIKYLPNLLFEFWPIILTTAVSRWQGIKKKLLNGDIEFGELMLIPYGLVIQIHLSIFLIGFLRWLKVDPTITTVGVMIFYYFPFSIFRRSALNNRDRSTQYPPLRR
jgi:hypothetical protein